MSRKWLVSAVTAAALSLATWAGASIISHGQKLSAHDATLVSVDRRLERIEDYLLQLLRDR
jgi:hypothetical protein